MGNFKLILIIVFIALGILGVMVFAGVIKVGGDEQQSVLTGNVVLWGTVKSESLSRSFEIFNSYNKTFKVIYVQKSAENFDQELLEALAEGKGPDLFLMSDSLAYHYYDKIYTIPYANFPLVNFKNTYAGAAEVFLSDKGTLAFPLSVDPMVMYYNRSILDSNGIIYAPQYWNDFSEAVSKVTKKDESGKILKTGVALGQFSNVSNAKDIISALFLQLGNPIIKYDIDKPVVALGDKNTAKSLGSALGFYTSFSDPTNPNYSWNKSYPNSQDAFTSDSLAFYFGFASELPILIKKNPNQNLGIASIPQIKNANFKATSAHVTGIAVSSFSKNFNTAYAVASALASGDFASDYAKALNVTPARRDLLAKPLEGVYSSVFYSNALVARSWLDPSSKDTDNIYRLMVESVIANNAEPADAVADASSRLNLLLTN